MQTPFELIRSKQKKRRERIQLSLSPTRHAFSLQSPRPSTQALPAGRKITASRTATVRSLSSKNDLSLNKIATQEQYKLTVQNTLKKVSNYQLSIGRHGHKLEEYQERPNKAKRNSRNLVVEGAHCGKDLIRLNRKKLEQMVAQINGDTTEAVPDVPEIVIEKCRLNKFRAQFAEENELLKLNRYAKKHRDSKQRENGCKSERSQATPPPKFDCSQFLICSQVQTHNQNRLPIQVSSYSFALNSEAIIDFIRQSKLRKYCSNRGEREGDLQGQVGHRNVAHAKTEGLQLSLSPKRWKEAMGKHKKEAVFNAFDMRNLQGWESPEEEHANFLAQPFPCT